MEHAELATLAALVAKELAESIAASPGKWMTMREAMNYCKVRSEDTIRSWITKGYIYGHKRTGQWIIDRESIDDWFNSERVAC